MSTLLQLLLSDTETCWDITPVRPADAHMSAQGLPYFYGISEATVGATGLAMHLVEIPPGGRAEAHKHRNFETAIYILEGRVETRYGEYLEKSLISEPGSFLFIPPDVPHQPINLSHTHTARAIIARNDANEQEDVVLLEL